MTTTRRDAIGLATTAGAALLLVLMALFFGPTKIIPIGFSLGTLFVTLVRPDTFTVD